MSLFLKQSSLLFKNYFLPFLLTLVMFLLGSLDEVRAQTLDFALSAGGTGSDFGQEIDVDNLGNSYVAGSFQGTVDFDSGSGVPPLTSAGSNDAFVVKYDATGALVWVFRVGGSLDDRAIGIDVDAAGDIYVTGFFSGTADFNGTSLTSLGATDVFVAKYNNAGNLTWALSAGGGGFDEGFDVAADDATGEVYITGRYSDGADFGGGALAYGGGVRDGFVAKYDSAGNYLWAFQIGGAGNEQVYGVALDGVGNLFVSGFFGESGQTGLTADFDPGPSVFNLTSLENKDGFVAKYDTASNFGWAFRLAGTGDDGAFDITYDTAGSVYVTGGFGGTADFDPGSGTFNLTSAGTSDTDSFVAKYDASSTFLWAFNLGGAGSAEENGRGIIVNPLGNVTVTGGFEGSADFDPGPGDQTLVASGPHDAYVAQYDATGAFNWAFNIGPGGDDFGFGIATDAVAVYVTGLFQGAADFDPGPGTFNLSSIGSYDIYVGKYVVDSDGDGVPDDVDQCPESDLSSTVIIDSCDSGVENKLFENGCTILDEVSACGEGARNHGQFVSCVADLTNRLKKDGVITGAEKGAIQSCAAQANLP